MAPDVDSLSTPAPRIMKAFARHLCGNDGRIAIFLDNYQTNQASRLDSLIDILLKHGDARLHLVVASRTEPGFASATFRASGDLVDIAESDLAFTRDEAAALLGDVLGADDVGMLADKTEGWPVVLQMANSWIRRRWPDAKCLVRPFSGDLDDMCYYLAQRLLSDLPSDLQSFLLQTSILGLVNGDLANRVCGRTDAWQCLDRLCDIGGLVIPLGHHRRWFRYHPVLEGFLREQLPCRFGEDMLAELHVKASAWWLDNKGPMQAAYHAWRAGDVDQLLDIVVSAPAVEFWRINSVASFDRLIKGLTEHLIGQSPRLQCLYAFYLMKQGRPRKATDVLEKIDQKHPDAYFIGCMLKVYLDRPVTETY